MKTKKIKNFFFVSIIIIQLGVIFFLTKKILNHQKNILGKTSVHPITKNSIVISPAPGLKYFYEPKANIIEEVRKDWLPYVPKYTINADALNERFNYSVKKDVGVFRIITIGDSYTFGVYVSTKYNWTELLENYLNKNMLCSKIKKYEVINLGVGGYDTAYEVERYKIRGIKYNPDLIIWYITDLYRITDKIQELAKEMNIDEQKNEDLGIFYEAWRKAREIIIEQYTEEGLINYQLSLLKNFRKKYYPVKPILFMSGWPQIKRAGLDNVYYADTVVAGKPEYLLPDRHFNNLGHEAFMEEVVAALKKYKLIPCQQ